MTDTPRGARVFVTGCTGFVGKVVLEELMRRREELNIEKVYLLIRPRRGKSAEERFDHNVAPSKCFSRLEPGWRKYCQPVAGDSFTTISDSPLKTGTRSRWLSHIIHCAASVRSTCRLPRLHPQHLGALRVLEFANGCIQLTRLVDVSTAYVTPHPGNGPHVVEEKLVDLPFNAEEIYARILAGEADEDQLLASTGHPNTYTFTKCLAERILTERRGDVPLTLLRPSIVSACRVHPFPGWIDSHAAYAAFISLIGAGYLRVIRTDPNTAIDVVPCDDVATRILSCAFEPHRSSRSWCGMRLPHREQWRVAPPRLYARETFQGRPARARGKSHLCRTFERSVPVQRDDASQSPPERRQDVEAFKGQKRAAVRIKKLANVLGSLDDLSATSRTTRSISGRPFLRSRTSTSSRISSRFPTGSPSTCSAQSGAGAVAHARNGSGLGSRQPKAIPQRARLLMSSVRRSALLVPTSRSTKPRSRGHLPG